MQRDGREFFSSRRPYRHRQSERWNCAHLELTESYTQSEHIVLALKERLSALATWVYLLALTASRRQTRSRDKTQAYNVCWTSDDSA